MERLEGILLTLASDELDLQKVGGIKNGVRVKYNSTRLGGDVLMESQKKSRASSNMTNDLSGIYPTESPIVAMDDYIAIPDDQKWKKQK
jgi:hypothetical protein